MSQEKSADGRFVRIFCVSNYFAGHGGGVERVAHGMAFYFVERANWQTTLAAHVKKGERVECQPYRVVRVRCINLIEQLTGIPLILPLPWDLLAINKEIKNQDIILIHDNIYILSIICIILSRFHNKITVIVKHTGIIQFKSSFVRLLQKAFNRLIFKPLLKLGDLVIFVNQRKLDNFGVSWNGPRIEVIPNGVDTRFFELGPHRTSAAQRARSREICFVGRFVQKKGIDLIKSIAELLPEYNFTLVGFGPIDPRQWGLANVSTLWRPPRHQIAAVYGESALTLVPGVVEGVPLVVLESLACGTPVLASQYCETPDSVLGSLIYTAPYDPSAPAATASDWAAQIVRILEKNPGLDENRLRQVVVAKYSEEATYSKYVSVINEMMESKSENVKRRH